MSKADAYREAERLIAASHARGVTRIDLATPKTLALTTLPPELSTLTDLTTLDLGNTQVIDLSPLTQLTALTTLNLSRTRVTDLAPLTRLTALTTLDLSGTKVTDLAPLSQLTLLSALDLSGTRVLLHVTGIYDALTLFPLTQGKLRLTLIKRTHTSTGEYQ